MNPLESRVGLSGERFAVNVVLRASKRIKGGIPLIGDLGSSKGGWKDRGWRC